MTIRTEKDGAVWTIIHSRPEARNAMDPESAMAVPWRFTKRSSHSRSTTARTLQCSREKAAGPVEAVIAVAGPAVAGGMELAHWADIRIMEKNAFMGAYCRRWGIPLIDGGTVRLPRLVGEGRAMDLLLTGRKVAADEALRIGLCEYVVPDGESRTKAEQLAHDIARFPQNCMRADRRSARMQHGLSERDALRQEWWNSKAEVSRGIEGAARFAGGKGRGGDFKNV